MKRMRIDRLRNRSRWAVLTLLLLSVSDIEAGQDSPEGVVLKTGISVSGQGLSSWGPLEQFLNTAISNRGERLRVQFVPMEKGSLADAMAAGILHAAILSPLRYIHLDLDRPLVPIGRLLRGRSVQGSREMLPTKEDTLFGLEKYSSVILMRRDSGAWPPDGDSTNVVLGAHSAMSTSGFVLPAAWLQEQLATLGGDGGRSRFRISVLNPAHSGPGESVGFDLVQVVRNPGLLQPTEGRSERERVLDLLDALARPNPGFAFMGIGSDWYLKMVNSELRQKVYELGRSSETFFDVFAVDAEFASKQQPALAMLRDALLSTRNVTHAVRTNLFKPTYNEELSSWGYVPDIHSFESVEDSDYDDVRKKWVRLSGGMVIRLGVAGVVHADIKAGLEYFRGVRRLLMKAPQNGIPVFLQVEFRPEETLQDLARSLEAGELDLIEANASEAGKLLCDGTAAALAIAEFRDLLISDQGQGTDRTNSTSHRMVALDAGGESDWKMMVDRPERIAHADERTSSGHRFPIYDLMKNQKSVDKLRRERLLKVSDYLGVYKALKDFKTAPTNANAARFGIIAEYEWFKLIEKFPTNGLYRIKGFGRDNIPNTLLLVGSHLITPNLLVGESGRLRKSIVDLFSHQRVNSQETEVRRRALAAFTNVLASARPAIDPNSTNLGFIRYATVDPATVRLVKSVHRHFEGDKRLLTVLVLLGTVTGMVLIVMVLRIIDDRGAPETNQEE